MINPSQLLDLAIEKQDWKLVELVKKSLVEDEQIKKPILSIEKTFPAEIQLHPDKLFQRVIVKPENIPGVITPENKKSDCITTSKGTPIKNEKGIQARKIPTQPVENRAELLKWHDTFSEETSDLQEKNPELVKLYGPLKDRQPKPNRNPLIPVQCSVCGQSEEITPILAMLYDPNPEDNTYKCNSCIIKGRKRNA